MLLDHKDYMKLYNFFIAIDFLNNSKDIHPHDGEFGEELDMCWHKINT